MRTIIFIYALLLVYLAEAQVRTINTDGDYFYKNMMYAPAIQYYESSLELDTNQLDVKVKLAYCYKEINDTRNAERVYTSIIKQDSTDAAIILDYAEVLNSNGKHSEAKLWYGKYANMISNDYRGKSFKEALSKMGQFYADSTKYQVDYLSINSEEPDFSPAIYQKGWAFCSGRKKNRLSNSNNSPYLDIYYVEDTSSVIEMVHKTSQKPDQYTPKEYKKANKISETTLYQNLNDDYTLATSNDTKTIGYAATPNAEDNADNTSITPVSPFNKKLNSKLNEGPFSFNQAQDTMYVTRNTKKKDKKGVKNLDIYILAKQGDGWGKAVPFEYNDKQYSTGHPSLSADGQTLFFASDRPGGLGGTDIWYCKKSNGKWSEPVNAGYHINTKGNEVFPYSDPYGDLYFSSDGLAGIGGLDIFKSLKSVNNTYGTPHNVGYPFNSMKDDFGVYIIDDFHGLFSSNRKNGGLDDDIYHLTILHKDPLWVKGYVVEEGTELPIGNAFVSQREHTTGEWVDTSIAAITFHDGLFYLQGFDYGKEYDILATADYYDSSAVTINTTNRREGDTLLVKIKLRKVNPVLTLSGIVETSDTKMPMSGMKVILYDNKRNKIVEYITGADGKYMFKLDTNNTYTVSSVKPNCGYNYERISTYKATHSKAYRINLDMVCKGDVIVLNDIFYDYNSTDIRKDAATELDKMVPWFFKYPDMQVELSSHADCRGGKDYNIKLTSARAKSAMDYLVSKDIHPSRIKSVGYGEQQPVVKCGCDDNKYKKACTEEEYQRNRRTEFKIVKIGTDNPKQNKPISSR